MLFPDQTTKLAVQNALLDAAAIIQKRGHCQRALEDKDGRVCLAGAINLVVLGHARLDTPHTVCSYAYGAIADYLDRTFSAPSFVSWNNVPGRTAGEVIAALENAAAEMNDAVHDSEGRSLSRAVQNCGCGG